MKTLIAFFALILTFNLGLAHYTIPDFISGGSPSADWKYIRETANYQSNGPLTDVTDPEIRCYELDMQTTPASTGTITVSAGDTIALHVASSFGGAQFYLSCAQVDVVNGGSGNPGPLVSFPGVYTGYEPGILINIYDLPSNFTGYQSPGPAVWSG
ncbi:hypothetical protein NLI96_g5359 [Meripilus lineatus]|uniref:lytic cellulose monooxygenase (C4-dehydrogenating) n=1 Tax=Meripilus lineatus TaxID=2056292 RepID=A0AAD5V4V6_9APHY|nr:hypothetical protein NLI96_g5359 [Physisporinus lineatus]